jgi:hypothetical protein
VAAVELTAPRERFSQTALPVIVPLAERIRVTIVASVLGVQSLNVSVPRRQGTPPTQMLSFRQRVLLRRAVDFGVLDERVKRHAQALCGFEEGSGKWMSTRGVVV